jgi:hypothetical protein
MFFFHLDFNCLAEFERAISIRLYNLITLQFVLRCPIDIVLHNNDSYCPRDYDILKNDLWQSRGWFVRDFIDTDQKRLIIYTVPYALSDHRSLRNHTCIAAQQSNSVDLKTYQLLSWTCTISKPSQVAQSLKGLSQARHLHWAFESRVKFYSFYKKKRHIEDFILTITICFTTFNNILCLKNVGISINIITVRQYRLNSSMVSYATSFIMSFYECTNPNRRSCKYDYTNAFCISSSLYFGCIFTRAGSMFETKTVGDAIIIESFTSLFRSNSRNGRSSCFSNRFSKYLLSFYGKDISHHGY